jgi:hypothetical protein
VSSDDPAPAIHVGRGVFSERQNALMSDLEAFLSGTELDGHIASCGLSLRDVLHPWERLRLGFVRIGPVLST